jgi:hypothetical protein
MPIKYLENSLRVGGLFKGIKTRQIFCSVVGELIMNLWASYILQGKPFCFNSRLYYVLVTFFLFRLLFSKTAFSWVNLYCASPHGGKREKEKVHAACMLLAKWMHQNKDTTQLIPDCRDPLTIYHGSVPLYKSSPIILHILLPPDIIPPP